MVGAVYDHLPARAPAKRQEEKKAEGKARQSKAEARSKKT
jgi:hypothetical protein